MYKRPVIYVAARLSAENQPSVDLNRKRAINYAYYLRQQGLVVFSPHETGILDNDCLSNDEWVEHGLEILSRCDECHVFVGKSERLSAGVRAEVEFCLSEGIRCKFIRSFDYEEEHREYDRMEFLGQIGGKGKGEAVWGPRECAKRSN